MATAVPCDCAKMIMGDGSMFAPPHHTTHRKDEEGDLKRPARVCEEGLIRRYRLRHETAFHSSNYRCHLVAEFVLRWQVAVDWRCFGGFPTSYGC